MGKDILKERYEKICKEDRELFEKMESAKENMMKLSDDITECNERIYKFFDIEKENGKAEGADFEILALRMTKLSDIQKDWMLTSQKMLDFIRDNKTLRENIFNFVQVINTTYDKMTITPPTKAHVSKVLHRLEIDQIELQTRYSNFMDNYEAVRKEMDGIIMRLDEFKV